MKITDFNRIYDQYYRLVMKVANGVVRDYTLAQDISQEVFVKFFKKADQIDPEYYRSWFIVNTKRKAIDYCRKSYQMHETVCAMDDDLNMVEEDTMADDFCRKQLTHRLMEELEEHNSDWYELIMRVVIEQEEPEKVARELGITIENLRTKLHRARVWIRSVYKSEFDEL